MIWKKPFSVWAMILFPFLQPKFRNKLFSKFIIFEVESFQRVQFPYLSLQLQGIIFRETWICSRWFSSDGGLWDCGVILPSVCLLIRHHQAQGPGLPACFSLFSRSLLILLVLSHRIKSTRVSHSIWNFFSLFFYYCAG
jgi:hypothetical protein